MQISLDKMTRLQAFVRFAVPYLHARRLARGDPPTSYTLVDAYNAQLNSGLPGGENDSMQADPTFFRAGFLTMEHLMVASTNNNVELALSQIGLSRLSYKRVSLQRCMELRPDLKEPIQYCIDYCIKLHRDAQESQGRLLQQACLAGGSAEFADGAAAQHAGHVIQNPTFHRVGPKRNRSAKSDRSEAAAAARPRISRDKIEEAWNKHTANAGIKLSTLFSQGIISIQKLHEEMMKDGSVESAQKRRRIGEAQGEEEPSCGEAGGARGGDSDTDQGGSDTGPAAAAAAEAASPPAAAPATEAGKEGKTPRGGGGSGAGCADADAAASLPVAAAASPACAAAAAASTTDH